MEKVDERPTYFDHGAAGLIEIANDHPDCRLNRHLAARWSYFIKFGEVFLWNPPPRVSSGKLFCWFNQIPLLIPARERGLQNFSNRIDTERPARTERTSAEWNIEIRVSPANNASGQREIEFSANENQTHLSGLPIVRKFLLQTVANWGNDDDASTFRYRIDGGASGSFCAVERTSDIQTASELIKTTLREAPVVTCGLPVNAVTIIALQIGNFRCGGARWQLYLSSTTRRSLIPPKAECRSHGTEMFQRSRRYLRIPFN